MGIYLEKFDFPSDEQETFFLWPPSLSADEVIREVVRDRRARNHAGSLYPFQILSKYDNQRLWFSDITILYGENGCGKSTAVNVIAEKLKLKRETDYNSGRFFPDYLEMCNYSLTGNEDDHFRMTYHEDGEMQLPVGSKIITSDDVFSQILKTREYNSQHVIINELLEEELANRTYDTNIERILAEKQMKVNLQKNMLKEKEERSNGQNAIDFFINEMENDALYIIDEPENSLSVESQIKLAEYIECISRRSQFIIVTHSPIIAGISNAKIYSFEDYQLKERKWQELSGVKDMRDYFETRKELFKK